MDVAFVSDPKQFKTFDPDRGIVFQRSTSTHKREGLETFVVTGPQGVASVIAELHVRRPKPSDEAAMPGVQNVMRWTARSIRFDGGRPVPLEFRDAVRDAFVSYAAFYGSGHPAVVEVAFVAPEHGD